MRADARAKREALVGAARRLFADQGLDVPLSTIAAEAGVGIATLYRHFPTRLDLLMGISDQAYAEIVAALDRCRETWDADPRSAWGDLIRGLAALRLGVLVARIADTDDREPFLRRTEDRRAAALDRLGALAATAQTAGLLRDDVTPQRLQLGLATLSRPLPESVLAVVPDDPDWLIEVFLRGVAR